jgi:hypothetical protein
MIELPVSIRGRFKRSVDPARDFHAADNIDGYIVTPSARKVLRQVQESLNEDRSARAWTLTGPYGGGKSAFALFASHVMRGRTKAIEHLRSSDPELAESFDHLQDDPFCPVLISGSRQPLKSLLLSGLAESVNRFLQNHSFDDANTHALRSVVETAQTEEKVADEHVANLFTKAADAVQDLTGGGLFVVVDELGKMLEYAAVHPDEGDIFVLQMLAERADRTAGGDEGAFFLTTILHQAFERYASNLDRVQREEWQKVQGRFEDVAFVEPADTTLQLLAEAIQVEESVDLNAHYTVVSDVLASSNLPKRFDEEETEQLLRQALPLHPTVGLIVGPLFHRLAQNERSLFAFLAAGEPGGFLDVFRDAHESDSAAELPLYRLDHLYDYLLTTLGATLFSQSTSKLWAETEAALGRMESPTEIGERLLKQIALLNFAGEMAGLTATTDLLVASNGESRDTVEEELQRLAADRVVVHRKYDDSYRIWQGSDIDLDEEIERARSDVSANEPLASLLRDVLPPSPVAAYRHSYDTGTTRVFDVVYASGTSLDEDLARTNDRADGHIVYVLPERENEREDLIEDLKDRADDRMLFFAVPDGVGSLRNSVYELRCLDWVSNNVDELSGDAAARRELRERRADLENRVESRLNRLLVADKDGRNPCEWIHEGESFRIAGRRGLQDHLSTACDETFTKTPEIWNELLNLREPSPSAVRGQKKLLEAIAIGNEEEGRDPYDRNLGIDGTPAEYGLYVSIVRATGMHRKRADDQWYFTHPDQEGKPGCYAVWTRIEDIFKEANGKPISLDVFFDELIDRPYGVRQGLIPVFLFSYFKANEEEIALYEKGTLLKELDFGNIERLLKTPDDFEMQQVKIEGARRDVLRALAPLVGLTDGAEKPLPVALRLLKRVHGLPPFVRKTSRMSEEALAVREVLYRSTDPTALLFDELPGALNIGIDSFLDASEIGEEEIQVFVRELQQAVRETTGAYDLLIGEIQRWVAAAFRARADEVEEQRHEIAERAQVLQQHVSDADLKSFVIRATNEMMDLQAWYESIASLLAGKPPVKWTDDDIDTFKGELKRIARKFRNRESLIFEGEESGVEKSETQREEMQLHRIRLGITMLGEPEKETVVQIHPEDEDHIDEVIDRVYNTLESDETLKDKDLQVKLAALGKLIQRLEEESEASLDAELDPQSDHE